MYNFFVKFCKFLYKFFSEDKNFYKNDKTFTKILKKIAKKHDFLQKTAFSVHTTFGAKMHKNYKI